MTNEDIIRMAKESGLPRWYQTDEVVNMDLLGRFAALVAAHTLANIDPSKFMSYQEGYEAGRTAEREACAKVCIEQSARWHTDQRDVYVAHECAAAIRARGQE